jgi:hypothetical protein
VTIQGCGQRSRTSTPALWRPGTLRNYPLTECAAVPAKQTLGAYPRHTGRKPRAYPARLHQRNCWLREPQRGDGHAAQSPDLYIRAAWQSICA